jgi:polyhydroxybutyrate depolymerase
MKKIMGILIMTLLIGTMIIPVTGKITVLSNDNIKSYSFNHNDYKNTASSQLKFMIAGSGLRFLRFYRIYVPPSYDGSESFPLLLAFHGSTGVGKFFDPGYIIWFYQDTWFEGYTDLNEKADEEGFIVVYPKALLFYSPPFSYYYFGFNVPVYPESWFRWRSLTDDVGFVVDLIDKMENVYNIDSDRIYLTGFSNGADFTYSLGCLLSDKVAAIAPVAGEIAKKEADEEDYTYPPDPENPLPIIVFHGTEDPAYPWDGDQWGCGIDPSIQFWVKHNGCDPKPEIYESESGNIIRYTYSNGNDGSEVILYKTIGGGHWWPASGLVDTIQEIDATDLMWEFFKQHPKQ